jgi:hypothetical protein
MKIYTTIDCIKLTAFDKMLLAVIKGVLYDFRHSLTEPYCNEDVIYSIIIKYPDGDKKSKLTLFKVAGNTPPGLFEEVKNIIKPFTFGFQLQGGYSKEDNSTAIILQRFELERKTLNYYETTSKD